jgi:hypothetical protein
VLLVGHSDAREQGQGLTGVDLARAFSRLPGQPAQENCIVEIHTAIRWQQKHDEAPARKRSTAMQTTEDHQRFLLRRAQEETIRAVQGNCPHAARVHEQMAMIYCQRALEELKVARQLGPDATWYSEHSDQIPAGFVYRLRAGLDVE